MPNPSLPADKAHLDKFNLLQFLDPDSVKSYVSTVAAALSGLLPAAVKSAIKTASTALMDLSVGAFSIADVEAILNEAKLSIPPVDIPIFDVAVSFGSTVINIAVAAFGTANPQVIKYIQAVANGFLGAGW